jgi:hypothetical protein
MSVPKLYLNGTEIHFTVYGTYEVHINPENSKRQWEMNIYAGDSAMKPAQYQELIALLTSSALTFTDEEGTDHAVKVSEPIRVQGVLNGLPILSVTLEEPGFEDTEDEFNPEINGTFAGTAFTAKLSDYAETPGLVGEFQRAITGKIISSSVIRQYATWGLTIPQWNGPSLTLGAAYSFSFSYQDSNGETVAKSGSGRLISPPSITGKSLSVTIEEDI